MADRNPIRRRRRGVWAWGIAWAMALVSGFYMWSVFDSETPRPLFAAIILLIAIGCRHDVEINPTAAGVGEFRDTVEAYDDLREREREALRSLSDSATAQAIAEHATAPGLTSCRTAGGVKLSSRDSLRRH